MKTFELSSSMFHNLVQPDTYERFCIERMYDLGYELKGVPDLISNEMWNYYNFHKYAKELSHSCLEVYLNYLFPKGVSVDMDTMVCVYNFRTDSFYVTASIEDNLLETLEKLIERDSEKFANYLKKFNSSYDGFISYLPNNLEDFKACKERDFDKYVTILLDFFVYSVRKISIDDQEDMVVETFMDENSFLEFFTKEITDMAAEITDKYIKECKILALNKCKQEFENLEDLGDGFWGYEIADLKAIFDEKYNNYINGTYGKENN